MARSSLKNVIRLIDEVQEALPIEQSFLNDLKRSIEMTDVKNHRVPSQMYKPSSMECIRNMYYQRTGATEDPQSPSFNLIGICNSGSDTHIRIQQAVCDMIENGMDCEYVDVEQFVKQRELNDLTIVSKNGMETKLRHDKYHLSFMCDGIIRYKGHYYILELKTEGSNKWFNRKGVDPTHYDQGTAYATVFGLDEVIFVYIDRDMLNMKSFMFEVTGDMKQTLIGKITDCDGYVEKMITPPKPEVSKKACEYCHYKSRCRSEK